MQGPRLLSHREHSLITVVRAPPKTRQDDGDRNEQEEQEDGKPEQQQQQQEEEDDTRRLKHTKSRPRRGIDWCKRHLRFLGPGLIASAAYIDPGNYATDLAAGATFGYKLLSIVLISGLIGILMQILATRLGVVTGKDVASLCRASLHSRAKHTLLWRWGILYPLYLVAEAGIIFTDLAELLGTAIAFRLLIPKLPLYAGVLLTSLDVFIVLIAFNSYPSEKRNKSITIFEILIAVLVTTVLASFMVLIVRLSPSWGDVFDGYIPSSTIVANGALYTSVGIIGATVMPHALFLGSKLATIERTEVDDDVLDAKLDEDNLETGVLDSPRPRQRRAPSGPSLHMPQPAPMPSLPFPPASNQPRSMRSIVVHLHHAQVDIAVSLFSFALVVNSMILIVAGAAFFYNADAPANASAQSDLTGVQDGNLFSAHKLIVERIGQAFGYLFALALMMSGQAASITATLAGQVVSEGFIEWRTTPWKRRIATRLISMVPALAVSAGVGEGGVNTLLVASQVTLSIVLPFVMFPMLVYTSSRSLMSIKSPTPVQRNTALQQEKEKLAIWRYLTFVNPFASRPGLDESVCFANNFFVMGLGWTIFIVVVIADIYALVQLGRGDA